MKYILAFFCGLILSCGFQSQNSNLVPMYGNLEKPYLLRMADKKFIHDIKSQGLSADSGSRKMASLGWSYLGRGDKETAMKRFNQCWLLDSTNYECYWGFGSIEYLLKGPDEAIKYYEIGLYHNRKSVKFNLDVSSAYIQKYITSGKLDQRAAISADSIINAQRDIDSLDQKYICLGAGVKKELGHDEEACKLAKKCSDPKFKGAIDFECN
jgi:tetratricopeptide (TPR) repeat protein